MCTNGETKNPNERKEWKNDTEKRRKTVRQKQINVRMFSPVRKTNSRSKFLRNISIYVPICTVSHPRRPIVLEESDSSIAWLQTDKWRTAMWMTWSTACTEHARALAGPHQRNYKPSVCLTKGKTRELVLAPMKQTPNRPKLTDSHNYEHYSLFP